MMKRIEVLDKAAEVGTKYCDINVNPTFGAAYFYSQEAGNDLINFGIMTLMRFQKIAEDLELPNLPFRAPFLA